MNKAEHYQYNSNHEAEKGQIRFAARYGVAVSSPWQNEYGTWFITVLWGTPGSTSIN